MVEILLVVNFCYWIIIGLKSSMKLFLISIFLGLVALGVSEVIKINNCDLISKYKRVVVAAAHPDDIETIAGGAVALFSECGANVNYIITTNGDKGWGKDTTMTSTELAAIREQEQLNAAKILNVNNVTFLRQEDGRLDGVDPILLKRNMTKWIRIYQPDLVLSFSPELDYNTFQFGLMHEDHRQTGRSTLNTLWPSARDYLNYYDLYEDGILPWICPEAWLFSFSSPVTQQQETIVVDLNDDRKLFDRKYEALLQHKSQYSDATAVKNSILKIGNYVARSNLPKEDVTDMSLAEAFLRVTFL